MSDELTNQKQLEEVAHLYGRLTAISSILVGFASESNYQMLRMKHGVSVAESTAKKLMDKRHEVELAVAALQDEVASFANELAGMFEGEKLPPYGGFPSEDEQYRGMLK